jgi:hypothetical protein
MSERCRNTPWRRERRTGMRKQHLLFGVSLAMFGLESAQTLLSARLVVPRCVCDLCLGYLDLLLKFVALLVSSGMDCERTVSVVHVRWREASPAW